MDLCDLAREPKWCRHAGIAVHLLGPSRSTATEINEHFSWRRKYYVTPIWFRHVRFANFMEQLVMLGPTGRTTFTTLQVGNSTALIHGEEYADNIKSILRALPEHLHAAYCLVKEVPSLRCEFDNCRNAACTDDLLTRLSEFLGRHRREQEELDLVLDLPRNADLNTQCGEYLRVFRLRCLKQWCADQRIGFERGLVPHLRRETSASGPASPQDVRAVNLCSIDTQRVEATPSYTRYYYNPETFKAYLLKNGFLQGQDYEIDALIAYQRSTLYTL